MKEYYEITCPITGYLPCEDEDIADAFDGADCGVLHDVELTDEDSGKVTGHYTFQVIASSEKEALASAQGVFDDLWDSGKVDCGDLEDTDRENYENGDEYRFNGVKYPIQKEKQTERE